MSQFSTDVTAYKEDLHKAPQGPLHVKFRLGSMSRDLGMVVGPSRIPSAPNPDSREKLL